MLPALQRVLYLHGFASSPSSRKASFLAARLRGIGFDVEIPALDGGDFAHLTITRQLALLRPLIEGSAGQLAVIGSSLGGYLAALAAHRHAAIERLVLLAPAFDFYRLWNEELGPERLSAWQERGTIEVYHYAAGKEIPLSYDLMRDAEQYPAFPDFSQPALILHGEDDVVVPIRSSESYAAAHPNCTLLRFPSGHELTDVLEGMWPPLESFLTARGR